MLRLPDALAAQIRAHGQQTYPNECCGALLGRDKSARREVFAIFPLENRRRESARNRFSLTAEDVRTAEAAAGERGLEVVGWYHSHPDAEARPSDYDREHAWPWYSYLIAGVRDGTAQEITSWRLAEDRSEFRAEEIEVPGLAGSKDRMAGASSMQAEVSQD